MKRFLTTATTVAAITCPALGTVTVGVDVSTDSGKVANALKLTTTQGWTGAGLFVELTSGSVINLDAGLGGVDTAPLQAQIDANPALLFDTYVGRVNLFDDNAGGGAVDVGGTDPINLGPTGLSAEWTSGLNLSALNDLAIGNFVFTDDAAGTWSLGITESYNAQVKYIGGTVAGGVLKTDFVPGDLNVDNYTGIDDLNILLVQWNTDGSGDPRSDPSGDNFVGIDDLGIVLGGWNQGAAQGPWSYSPLETAGDLDGDGFVGLNDLNILLGDWHNAVTPGSLSDPSGDAFVGLDDYNILSTFWNNGTPPISVVPEPVGWALMTFGTLALLRKRKV